MYNYELFNKWASIIFRCMCAFMLAYAYIYYIRVIHQGSAYV